MIAFDREERLGIEAALREDGAVPCPRCATALVVQPVDPGPTVAYVRHRALVVCAGCGAHASLDTPQNPGPG